MRRASEGFVLIVVSWVLAVLAVLGAYVDGVVTSQVENARLAKQAFERELELYGTQATVTYLLVTSRMNHRGPVLETPQRFSDLLPEDARLPDRGEGELHVTGRVYAGLGNVRFTVQDEGGLVPINSPQVPWFGTLLRRVGIAPGDVTRIVRRIEDYIDMDSTLHVNGAEAGRYRASGKPPPPNWIMASPLELQNVLGVPDIITDAQWRRLLPLLSIRPSTGYHFDTMPPEVLAATLDIDLRSVPPLLHARTDRTISSLSLLTMLTGKHLDIDPLYMRETPSRFLRISLWHGEAGVRTLAGLELTPFSDVAPWRIDYRYDEPATEHDTDAPQTVATPLLQ